MKAILSKDNPPQVGDRLVHNGAVCIQVSNSNFAVWEPVPNEPKQIETLYHSFLFGLEVERAEEPIVIVRTKTINACTVYGQESRYGLFAYKAFLDYPEGTRFVLIPESEYKRLKGEK